MGRGVTTRQRTPDASDHWRHLAAHGVPFPSPAGAQLSQQGPMNMHDGPLLFHLGHHGGRPTPAARTCQAHKNKRQERRQTYSGTRRHHPMARCYPPPPTCMQPSLTIKPPTCVVSTPPPNGQRMQATLCRLFKLLRTFNRSPQSRPHHRRRTNATLYLRKPTLHLWLISLARKYGFPGPYPRTFLAHCG